MTHMPMEPEAFAEQVAGLLRRMQPEYAIAMVNPRELLVNGRRLDLDNLYRMVTNEPGRGQEIVEHFLDQLFTGDGLEVGDMPFEFARARVMPRIQPESIFEHLSRDLVAHVPFVNNTVVVFVTDLEAELHAARGAGVRAVAAVRPGNAPLSAGTAREYPVIRSLLQLCGC